MGWLMAWLLGGWTLGRPGIGAAIAPLPTAGVAVPMPSVPKSDVQELKALYPLAESITVRVMAHTNGGSGTLIQRQGHLYTVLTNRHVLTSGPPYSVQTPDQTVHPATVLDQINFQGKDLAILQFSSGRFYAIATLGPVKSLHQGETVIAAGFPFPSPQRPQDGFHVTDGHVSVLPQQALLGGYRIGYTNRILKGMSGGPVINRYGEVVGINSLHAYPLWGNPYVFEDGSHPDPLLHQMMTGSSWAVPVETAVCLATILFPPPSPLSTCPSPPG